MGPVIVISNAKRRTPRSRYAFRNFAALSDHDWAVGSATVPRKRGELERTKLRGKQRQGNGSCNGSLCGAEPSYVDHNAI